MSGKLEKILVPVGFSEGSRRAPRSVLMAHALPRQAAGSTLTPVRGCASSGEDPGTTGVHGEEDVLGLQKAREVSDLAHGNARPPVGSANFSETLRRPSVSSFPRSPFARDALDSCFRRNDGTGPCSLPFLSFPRRRESRMQGPASACIRQGPSAPACCLRRRP